MATHGELVDLSLFAESPTNDWRYNAMEEPSFSNDFYSTASGRFQTPGQVLQSPIYARSQPPQDSFSRQPRTVEFNLPPQRHTTYERGVYASSEGSVIRPLPRSYTLKPLPPLPPKKLCKPRPSRARTEAQSRCILQRLKKTRSEDLSTDRICSLQQRRNLPSTPQLTLTVSGSNQQHPRPANEMVWLPEEQMWLVMNQYEPDLNFSPPQHSTPRFQPHPSPSIYSYPDTTPPLTPDGAQPRNAFIDDDGLSPIQSQFRSLIIDEERRSPLFQEATQTIPDIDATIEAIMSQGSDEGDWPAYDPAMYESPADEPINEPASPESPHTPDSSYDDVVQRWNDAVSIASTYEEFEPMHSRDTSDQSYHSAVSSMGAFSKDEDPVDFYLGSTPVWAGIAKSISGRTSGSTTLRSGPPSSLSYQPSMLSHVSRETRDSW